MIPSARSISARVVVKGGVIRQTLRLPGNWTMLTSRPRLRHSRVILAPSTSEVIWKNPFSTARASISWLVTAAAMGIPPPNVFDRVRISGGPPSCSKGAGRAKPGSALSSSFGPVREGHPLQPSAGA
jgi:hypothetical protein